MNTKVGHFSALTSGGPAQAITGVGFTPKAVIFFTDGKITDNAVSATSAVAMMMYGITDGTRQCVGVAASLDGAVPLASGRQWLEDKCIAFLSAATPTADGSASITSMDADGFTVTWSSFPATARIVRYLAIGGSDVSAFLKLWTADGNTSANFSQAQTGVGFLPQMIFSIIADMTAVGTSTSYQLGFGWATGTAAAAQESIWTSALNGGSNSSVSIKTTAICAFNGNRNGSLTAFGSDGFTIQWDVSPGGAIRIGTLCLMGTGGVAFKAASDTQPATNIAVAKTGHGFQPKFEMFFTAGNLVGGSGMSSGLGVTDGVNMESIGAGEPDATNGHIRSVGHSNEAFEIVDVSTLSAYSSKGSAVITSMDVDGYTLTWSGVDGSARTFFGVGGGTPTAPQESAPYRDTLTGTWVPTPGSPATLFDKISELVADDSNYISSSLSPAVADISRVKLNAVNPPGVTTGHHVRIRYRKNATGGDRIDLTVRLMQRNNATNVFTELWNKAYANIDAITTDDVTLTGAVAATITDYGELYLQFEAIKV